MFSGCLGTSHSPAIYYNGGLYHSGYYRDRVLADYSRCGGYPNDGYFRDWYCNSPYGNARFYQGYYNNTPMMYGNFCGGGGQIFGGSAYYDNGGMTFSW